MGDGRKDNMVSTRALLARAAKFITDINNDTDWHLYATMFDIEDIADNVPRLYRSQSFHDPDYSSCVHKLFQDIAEEDENLAIEFVRYVISQEFNLENENIISKDPELLQALDLGGEGEIKLPVIPYPHKKYLNVKVLPGDFYIELQEQINKAFAYGILSAVQILSRKFLENLIVDILRKKYGMQRIELFYNTSRRKCHGFEVLLKNLHDRIDDFIGISPAFNDDFLKKINKFREQGNSSAHTIELNLDKEELEKDAKDLEYIIKLLVKVLKAF